MTRVSLDLTVQVEDANARTFRWGPDEIPENRLRNISFSTKIGEGFSSAQGQLSRRIDLDYPDLGLVDTISFIGADGTVAWEGRASAFPRELSDAHSIGVTLTGWMAHTKDRKFTEIFVDRDLGSWGSMSVERRGGHLATNFMPSDGGNVADPDTSVASLRLAFQGAWTSPYKPISEMWYDAGSQATIARIEASVRRTATSGPATAAPWTFAIGTARTTALGSFQSTGNLVSATNPSGHIFVPDVPHRYGIVHWYYDGTPGGGQGVEYDAYFYKVAVYGNHRLTRRTGEPGEPGGFYASDVMENIIRRFCPKLDIGGVTPSSYVIQHLVFRTATTPYDALLELNKYHLWNLAVWENKTLHFAPYDLTTYDWQVRTYDPGVEFSPQGPSIDDTFNGIEVVYTDVLKGVQQRLTPDTHPELASTDPTNPWNVHAIQKWDEISLSTPTTEAAAAALGRAALGERSHPKAPGTIKVTGYIRNRLGVEEPAWKVRAGDTIAVTDFPNDQPRLIVETSWDDERKELSISVDKPFALLDAYIDRLGSAVGAKNLG